SPFRGYPKAWPFGSGFLLEMNTKSSKRILFCILVLAVLSGSASARSLENDECAAKLVEKIYFECLNGDYKQAIQDNKELIRLCPQEPLPRFFLATIYMYLLRSYWDYPKDKRFVLIKSEFENLIKEGLKVCDNYPNQNANVYFCKGGILGTAGLIDLQAKNWLKAYLKGQKAIAALNKALELNPEQYDAYLGLGIFEYYCARLTGTVRILAWIVGFTGDKDKGLEYMKKAMKKGKYSNGPAKVFLAGAYLAYENEILKSIALTKELRAKYPGNILYIDYVVRAAKKLPEHQVDLGIEWINNLIKIPHWKDLVNLTVPFDLDTIDFELACLFQKKGDYVQALSLLEALAANRKLWNDLTAQIHLKLLQLYKKSGNLAAAKKISEQMLDHTSINRSPKKARLFIK
ncbi:hypothetical protein ACFL27_16030, partial [candidate division CSSED10-310 bacterium]